MSIGENIKAKIDELELERHLKQLVEETEKTVDEAVGKAGTLAHERRDEIVGWVEKATGKLNEQTKGQYAEKVDKVRTGLLGGLDKLAAKRPLGDPVAPIEAPADPSPDAAAPDASAPETPATETQPTDVTPPDTSQQRPPTGPDGPAAPPNPFA